MRLVIVGTALLLFTNVGAAQSRWTISAGPELTHWWGTELWGMRLRAEYDLTSPRSMFGLRLEGGARWGPTQSFFCECAPGRIQAGSQQRSDLMLGLSGSIAPFAHSRFSPYFTMGVLGRQVWTQGEFFLQDSALALTSRVPRYSFTNGDIIGTMGVGVRARLSGRSFQLELRRIYDSRGLTFGTRLPF